MWDVAIGSRLATRRGGSVHPGPLSTGPRGVGEDAPVHASSPAHAGPAWPLVAAAWLAAIEAVVLGMVVVGRGRPLAAVWFVVKLVLCVRVVGRRAGAFLGLVL